MELDEAIKYAKKRKATGEDEAPMEFFKELNDDSKEEVLGIIHKWWEEERIEREMLATRVIMIFKKKDS